MLTYRIAPLLLVVAVAGPVRAAPSSACTVFTDPAGDAQASAVVGTGGGQLDPSLDLLSASFSGVDATLRVQLHVNRPDGGVVGRTWTVTFADGESKYALVASQQPDGTAFDAFGPGADNGSNAESLPPLASISGTVDLARGLITFEAPLSTLHLSPRSRFQDFQASSGRAVGTTGGLLRDTPLANQSPALSQSTTVVSDVASGVRNYRIDRGCRPFS